MCDCNFLPHYFIWSTEDTQQLYPNRLGELVCIQVCDLKLLPNSEELNPPLACWNFPAYYSLQLGMKPLNHYMVGKPGGNAITGSEKQLVRSSSF